MQPIPPEEVVARLRAERKQSAKRQQKGDDFTRRRRDAEFERDLKEFGFDVRGGVEL